MKPRSGLFILLLLLRTTLAAADPATWQISEGQIRAVCTMTVGGTFDAVTHAVSGTLTEPPKGAAFGGAIAADLRTMETGIGFRDEHMRNSYLEVGRGDGFDKAVLTDLHVSDVDPHTFEGQTTFTATLLLHGAKRPIHGQARVRRDGEAARVEAVFPVRLSEYGVPKPQYLGVGVKDEVEIKVTLVAAPGHGGPGAAP